MEFAFVSDLLSTPLLVLLCLFRRRRLELNKIRKSHEVEMGKLEEMVKKKVSNLDSRSLEIDAEILSHQGRIEKLRDLISDYVLKVSGKQEEDKKSKKVMKKQASRRRQNHSS